ncbi:DUF1275 domain-containing protein [Bradyrhizobium lablabi]|uniref:YoaK family protein n=1 Tax=Bradyrhizobium lablabi TaxID=722472 RepID=UPI001BA64E8B|nr:YoaK family protein [Bradyrhizobium lablabi]MBR1119914.1 DUF1275 domain-containing protein [Bradyrhizobium lablabi]
MAMEAASPGLAANGQVSADAPEQSLAVACLLTMSGGFLDAFSWLSLGGVFANSQTGNVVFLGMNLALGNWHQAAHHVPPILAFLAGAWVARRAKAPLLCLTAEIVGLTAVMLLLLLHRLPGPLAIIGMSFGVALQTASFRQVEHWKYISVTVTGNFLRAVEQLTSTGDREAARGARTMLTICLMFLLGAVTGGFTTVRLGASSLIVPLALLVTALWLCGRPRLR